MLTKEDKNWVEEKFAKELNPIRDSIDLLRGKVTNIHFEKFNLESRLDSIEASTIRNEEKSDKILSILDGFAGKVSDLEQENKMGAVTFRRHGIQIRELATATSTAISE